MYVSKNILAILGIFAIFCIFIAVYLGTTAGGEPRVPGLRAEFYIFAITLMGSPSSTTTHSMSRWSALHPLFF